MSRMVSLRMDEDLLGVVDEARKSISRSEWISEACRQFAKFMPSVPSEAAVVVARRRLVELPDEVEAPIPFVAGLEASSRVLPTGVVRGSQVAHRPTCPCPVCRPPKSGAQK